jgi:hypothetical protein
MYAYCEDVIEERRRNPGTDVLSRVVHAKIDGDYLNHQELIGFCTVLLLGGIDWYGVLAHECRARKLKKASPVKKGRAPKGARPPVDSFNSAFLAGRCLMGSPLWDLQSALEGQLAVGLELLRDLSRWGEHIKSVKGAGIDVQLRRHSGLNETLCILDILVHE